MIEGVPKQRFPPCGKNTDASTQCSTPRVWQPPPSSCQDPGSGILLENGLILSISRPMAGERLSRCTLKLAVVANASTLRRLARTGASARLRSAARLRVWRLHTRPASEIGLCRVDPEEKTEASFNAVECHGGRMRSRGHLHYPLRKL